MKIFSLFAESIRVANRLGNMNPRAGMGHAERFAAEFCSPTPEKTQESARSGKFEVIAGGFMKSF
jgi:hypothetical protein